MKKYRITVHYNGAMFTYYHNTDLENFTENLCSEQLLEQGFITLDVSDERNNQKHIYLSPQNCGHVEIEEVEK